MDRYHRQQVIPDHSHLDGMWQRLRVLLVGCGGVGTVVAQSLVRSGIGTLTIIDGDRVRETDLHRQLLYLPEDARRGTPKSQAACHNLQHIGGRSKIAGIPEMLTPRNAQDLFRQHDVVLDATDHIVVRSLIDRVALQTGTGWIHSGAIADRWVAASFMPPGTPCYHCWVPEVPAPGSIDSCETAGVLPVACLSAAAAVIRLLTEELISTDRSTTRSTSRKVIRGSIGEAERVIELKADPGCPHCGENASTHLSTGSGEERVYLRRLCGSGTIESWLNIDLDEIARRLDRADTDTRWNRGTTSIRVEDPAAELNCYSDGRCLITGYEKEDLSAVRMVLERHLGSDALHTY